jgi:hypothetical protein
VHTALWWGNLRERDHLKYLGLDMRVILKWILKERDGSMNWIDVTQDRDRWRPVLRAVISLRVE